MTVSRERGRQWLVRMGCPVIFCLSAAPLATAQQPNKDQVLRTVLEAFGKRVEKTNPIWVQLEWTHLETEDWQRVARRAKKPEPQTWVEEWEFARKGTKTRVWQRQHRAGVNEWSRDQFRIYNGEIEISPSNEKNVFVVSTTPDKVLNLADASPFDIVGEETLHGFLKLWAKGQAQVTVRADSETREMGERVRVVELDAPKTKWKDKCWFLPEKDWILLRQESYNEKGGPVDKWRGSDYREAQGLFYPKQGRHEHYLANGALGYTVLVDVKLVEVAANKIPDSLFEFEIPKDASVYDNDLKVMVRNADLTQSHLDEVIKRIAPSPPLWRRWWLITASAACLILLASVAYWRAKHRATLTRRESAR